jgi:hypothetical protein
MSAVPDKLSTLLQKIFPKIDDAAHSYFAIFDPGECGSQVGGRNLNGEGSGL